MKEKGVDFVNQYYAQQSKITNPSEYAYLFDDLPRDIPSLTQIVQGLIVHPGWAESYGLKLPAERQKEISLRTIPEMLDRILALDPSPLSIPRPPEKRFVGICRDFAVLLVSMLRFQDVPARLRVGFAGYFYNSGLSYWDHRITEYWNEKLDRWVMVDPQIDYVQRQALGLKIDTFNITGTTPFLLAGDVWQQCRTEKANPEEFGDSPDDVGMPPIRYALLHDFDALNKTELVGFDAWHSLIDKPEDEVTDNEREMLDEIAELTTHVDSQFNDLQALYEATPYGQAVQRKIISILSKRLAE